jgi:hypothetical protein
MVLGFSQWRNVDLGDNIKAEQVNGKIGRKY